MLKFVSSKRLVVFVLALLGGIAGCAYFRTAPKPSAQAAPKPSILEGVDYMMGGPSRLFAEYCAVCHGDQMLGAAQGPPLVRADLRNGDSLDELIRSIRDGNPERAMPSWEGKLAEAEIQSLAALIAERRLGYDYGTRMMQFDHPLVIPSGVVETKLQRFRLETVVEGLDSFPFSIAPMPDGSILLTEKQRGLRIISPTGDKSALIAGTPRVYHDDPAAPGAALVLGLGYLMEVALHPDFKENGWIYLHFTDRCEDCNEVSRREGAPVSMNKVVRGRIREGAWVDEEAIWSADLEDYTTSSDTDAGGRLAFDDSGYLFFSIGKSAGLFDDGIQDLGKPHGKIHRVHDDGRLPADNPFLEVSGAIGSIWNYGFRNSQGLEFDPLTLQLWGTDHGPRGGDEINHLLPGRNYGWPLHSLGMKYDGTPLDYAEKRGIEFDLKDIEQPAVAFTPSPGISSFVIYRGEEFPQWQGQIILGTLKGKTLYRVARFDGENVEREPLMTNLTRIRDVEVDDRDGSILLLLEHASGARILRMVAATSPVD